MNEQQIRELVIASLNTIAPEADLSSLQPDIRFRDQFDFDSIDCLNLVTRLGKELGIKIPEIDYPKLGTLNGCIGYLAK